MTCRSASRYLSARARVVACLLVCHAAGCSGEDSPTSRPIGEGTIVTQVGPGGRVLRGDGGTALEGLVVEIPPGALDRLIEIRIEAGNAIGMPGTRAESPAFRISTQPDPGVLRVPATLSLSLELPRFLTGEDLAVVGRFPSARPNPVRAGGGERLVVVAGSGVYDRDAAIYSAQIGSLVDLQLRRLDRSRLPEDALQLVNSGFAQLTRLTDASLREADQLFAEAQRADPFSPAANLFRAVSRVLVALNSQVDDTPDVDSIGEALRRFGFNPDGRSLVARLRTGIWPSRTEVPPDAPSGNAVVQMLQTRVVPALELAIRDLDQVTDTAELILVLPTVLRTLPGDREFDVGDLLAFRSMLAQAIAVIEYAATLELSADGFGLTRRGQPVTSLADALAANLAFGTVRQPLSERGLLALRAAVEQWSDAFASIAAEQDGQEDDLVVLPAGFGPDEFDRWRANLDGFATALRDGGGFRVDFGGGRGGVRVAPREPLLGGTVDPRAALPGVFQFLPLAQGLPDPTVGELFPTLEAAQAINLLRLTDRGSGPLALIRADGNLTDWPATAAGLGEPDPVGDARAGSLEGGDLVQVWFAQSADELAFRLDIADVPIAFRPGQGAVYRVQIETVEPRRLGRMLTLDVTPEATGLRLEVRRDGELISVRGDVAASGGSLEIVVDRFQLLDPDEPVGDRLIRGIAQVYEPETEAGTRDFTRGFLTRF